MNTFLTAIVLWLSANFGLPPVYEHPRIEFVPATKLVAMRYRGILPNREAEKGDLSDRSGGLKVFSVYDDASKTIFVREGWTSNSAAELSVLVHEMVHHLQNVGRLKFDCPAAREKLAYEAQEQWLRLFGHDLLRDFEVDQLTLLLITQCHDDR